MAYAPFQSNNPQTDGYTASAGGTDTTYSGGSHRHKTPITNKGDLLTTDTSTLNALAAGSNNTHLIANSAATNGLQWNSPAQFLKAEDATLNSGTFVNVGTTPNLSRVVNLADAATQGAFWSFMVPYDWVSGAISAEIYWSPAATDGVAHTVRWTMTCKSVAAGASVIAGGTATTFTGASAARTVDLLVRDTITSTAITPAAAGDLFIFGLQRIGADAADTYVGAVRVHGIRITY